MEGTIIVPGVRYGFFTVIEEVPGRIPGRNNPRRVRVRCDCGVVVSVILYNIKNGHTLSCGCYQKTRTSETKRLHTGEASFRELYRDYKRNAANRGLTFTLTLDFFRYITSRACVYCGGSPAQLARKKAETGVYTYNGLDRVDNSQGYEPGNVVPCCKTCNFMKASLSQGDFISQAQRIAEHTSRG